MPPKLHERIAKALGWAESDVRSFSFQTLRELVRPVNAALADDIGYEIQSQRYFIGETRKPPLKRHE